MKLQQGAQGIGTMIAETPQAVTSLLETLWAMGQDIILQEYIAESKGRDYRAIVVGGRVVASMRRQAKAGEFRSNLHRGGLGMRVRMDKRYVQAATAAVKVMGLEVAGVDMLEGRDGPKILEINSSPGLEGIERTSGVDVAGAIIAHAERFVARARSKRKPGKDASSRTSGASRRLRRGRSAARVASARARRGGARPRFRAARELTAHAPRRADERGPFAVWTIDRPEAKNALDRKTIAEFTWPRRPRPEATRRSAPSSMTGAGSAFVSGGDLRELREQNDGRRRRSFADLEASLVHRAGSAPRPGSGGHLRARRSAVGRSSRSRATCGLATPRRGPVVQASPHGGDDGVGDAWTARRRGRRRSCRRAPPLHRPGDPRGRRAGAWASSTR